MSEKRELRRALLLRRAALSREYRLRASRAIAEKIMASDLWQKARTVLAYFPVGEELFLVPLWERALAEGKRVAFPRCENGEMRFVAVTSLVELTEDAYRIPAPPEEGETVETFEATLAVVPALSADREGFRLGYGGGYYDRFLQKHPEVVTLCAIYDELFSPVPLIREPFDVPVQAVLTEKRKIGVL